MHMLHREGTKCILWGITENQSLTDVVSLKISKVGVDNHDKSISMSQIHHSFPFYNFALYGILNCLSLLEMYLY